MKKIVLFLLAALFVTFGLTGCSKYTSHYNAVMHVVYVNDSDSVGMSFGKFEGTEVFKLKCPSDKTARIQYSGKLETGSLTVYYDCGETKTELFSVQSGDEITACGDQLTSDTVYVIMETSEECENGNFSFEIICD